MQLLSLCCNRNGIEAKACFQRLSAKSENDKVVSGFVNRFSESRKNASGFIRMNSSTESFCEIFTQRREKFKQ